MPVEALCPRSEDQPSSLWEGTGTFREEPRSRLGNKDLEIKAIRMRMKKMADFFLSPAACTVLLASVLVLLIVASLSLGLYWPARSGLRRLRARLAACEEEREGESQQRAMLDGELRFARERLVEAADREEALQEQQAQWQEGQRMEREAATHLRLALQEVRTQLEIAERQREDFITAKEAAQSRLAELAAKLEDQRHSTEQREKELETAQLELSYERKKLAELKADYQVQKAALKDEFQALSETILQKRQHEVEERGKAGLNAILGPMKEEFGKFKARVNEVHSEQTRGQGQLENELKHLKTMNHQLSERAENLTSALRNDKKRLGNWGELQLERLLENAGLDQNCYRKEANFKTEEGANQRPDFIIDLPEKKSLIIDSKVTLGAYVDAVNASVEEEALQYLKQHTTNVRNHIKALSEKSYDSLNLLSSPDFVFLFMPNEAAYLAAFEEDASLFDFAYDRRIAVVTPNTLLPILRTVSSLWRIEQQNGSTAALADAAGKVYGKLVIFLERFEKIESQLETLSGTVQEAKKTLTSGKGNLVKLAEGFAEKGVRTKKALPESLREPSS